MAPASFQAAFSCRGPWAAAGFQSASAGGAAHSPRAVGGTRPRCANLPCIRRGAGGQDALCRVLRPHLATEARAEALLPMLQAREHQPQNVQSHLGEHSRTVVVHPVHTARRSPDVLSSEAEMGQDSPTRGVGLERSQQFVSVALSSCFTSGCAM